MKFKAAIFLTIILFTASVCFSQIKETQSTDYVNLELKEKYSAYKQSKKNLNVGNKSQASDKSPALALLYSIILPGAGHFYLNRMDVGKYFLGADALSWLGLISLNVYGDDIRDDSRTYSVEHAGVTDKDGKDDDFYTNIGSFSNVYQYNNDKLLRGEYHLLYDVNKYYWNWDNTNNQNIYEQQRKSSERVYNSRIIFGSLLIANRVVSGISAYLIASSKDKKSSSLHFEPELLYTKDFDFDGVKINIAKNF
ncbi:MAG: hypothetical protein HGGPFJEG_02024 [Ignavibacteria bacterium]|nr:hypothetical protein [Ignavibacteria bacterium]